MENTLEKVESRAHGVGKENEIYTSRFSTAEESTRQATWQVLVEDYFQQFISATDTVVDIGAGDGLFFRYLKAGRKIAVDLSDHVNELSKHGVDVYQVPADSFTQVCDVKADVIWMSNFLEHLPDKKTLLSVLEECGRALKPDGCVMILQPNIRYVGAAYWDYIDHHIALTEHSLVEALEVSGFKIVKLIPCFLPYTAKSKIGRWLSHGKRARTFARWYLRLPMIWRIFGGQTFVIARLATSDRNPQ